MRRRSKPHTFDERLNAEKTRIEARIGKSALSLVTDIVGATRHVRKVPILFL